jgi:hypothetical protein
LAFGFATLGAVRHSARVQGTGCRVQGTQRRGQEMGGGKQAGV